MGQVLGVCESCQQDAVDMAVVGDGTETRCRLCNGRLGGQTVFDRPVFGGASSGETRAAKAMLGEINAKGRRDVLNNLFYFGVLTMSFFVSMWLWWWLCENAMSRDLGRALTSPGSEELSTLFSVAFMFATFFLMNRLYRLCGIATPLEEIQNKVAERRGATAKGSTIKELSRDVGEVGGEASKFARQNRKGFWLLTVLTVLPTFVTLYLYWELVAKAPVLLLFALIPTLMWVAFFYFGTRSASQEVAAWSAMSGQNDELVIDLAELKRRPFELEGLRPLIEKVCVIRTEAPPMTSNRNNGYFCSFAVGVDGQLYDIEGSTDHESILSGAGWLAGALQVAFEDQS